MKVRVHVNLHETRAQGKPVYSVVNSSTGLAIPPPVYSAMIKDVKLHVGEEANRKILEEGTKRTVHAWASGERVTTAPATGWVRIRYNPNEMRTFVYAASGKPIHQALWAKFDKTGAWVIPSTRSNPGAGRDRMTTKQHIAEMLTWDARANPADEVVDVFLNLNQTKSRGVPIYSVRLDKIVIDHVGSLTLRDVKMHVGAGSQKRIAAGGEKMVHAWLTGARQAKHGRFHPPSSGWVRIRYNPRELTTFVYANSGKPVHSAKYARFGPDGVWVIPNDGVRANPRHRDTMTAKQHVAEMMTWNDTARSNPMKKKATKTKEPERLYALWIKPESGSGYVSTSTQHSYGPWDKAGAVFAVDDMREHLAYDDEFGSGQITVVEVEKIGGAWVPVRVRPNPRPASIVDSWWAR